MQKGLQETPEELALIEDIASFTHDPYGFVMYAFPWGEGELEKFSGPDDWQRDILEAIGAGLLNINEAIQIAVASGHDIGKSALVAMLIMWAMSTFEDTRGTVTANTDGQLRTKTWPELAKWYRLCICKHWFHYTATSLYSVVPEHEKNWRIDATPWSEINTEAFAGLHNQGRRLLLIFDEASAIDDRVWDVGDSILLDSDTEIIWCVFGNPTRNTGRFFDCFHKFRHRWIARQIDSRNVRISNKIEIAKMIEDHGIDSDYIKVRVRGEFPNASAKQFIPGDIVTAARGRHLREDQYSFAAKIISCDPAWDGGDETTIWFRQGNASKMLAAFPKNDDDGEIAGYLMRFEDELQADAVFIDFGYGTGIYSFGKNMGRNWTLVKFGGESSDPRYLNKRAQMWGNMKDWLREGSSIPDDPQLADEMTGPEYYIIPTGPNAGKIALESKVDMKRRGLGSPGRADGLATSFAFPVLPKRNKPNRPAFAVGTYDYDPFAERG